MKSNRNQPVNHVETPRQPAEHPIKNKRGNFPIIIGVLVLLLVILFSAYYTGALNTKSDVITQQNTASSTLRQINIEVSPTPILTISTDIKSNWESYTGTGYSFKYPSDWNQTGPEEYLETVLLLNPDKTVSIAISKGQYPFGFGSSGESELNQITININGKTIEANEFVTDEGAFVNFPLGEYYILYGTDYPAVGIQEASLTDYNDSKETIAEIFSSFKFTK